MSSADAGAERPTSDHDLGDHGRPETLARQRSSPGVFADAWIAPRKEPADPPGSRRRPQRDLQSERPHPTGSPASRPSQRSRIRLGGRCRDDCRLPPQSSRSCRSTGESASGQQLGQDRPSGCCRKMLFRDRDLVGDPHPADLFLCRQDHLQIDLRNRQSWGAAVQHKLPRSTSIPFEHSEQIARSQTSGRRFRREPAAHLLRIFLKTVQGRFEVSVGQLATLFRQLRRQHVPQALQARPKVSRRYSSGFQNSLAPLNIGHEQLRLANRNRGSQFLNPAFQPVLPHGERVGTKRLPRRWHDFQEFTRRISRHRPRGVLQHACEKLVARIGRHVQSPCTLS